MTRFCRMLLGSALLLLVPAGRARAGLSATVGTDKDIGISITVTGPVNQVPPAGCLPCWVTIRNDSGAAHTWNLDGHELALRYGNNGSGTVLSQSLRVKNGATVRIPLLIPLLPMPEDLFYRSVALRVDGIGVVIPETAVANTNSGGRSHTAFIGMGEALATPIWASLEKKYRDASGSLYGSPVDPAQLGPDWRGLSGFDALWLTDTEFSHLDPGQRAAIRQWVDQGGNFLLSAQGSDPAMRVSLGLPESGVVGHPGYGHVQWMPWDGRPLELDAATAIINRVRPAHLGAGTGDATGWKMTKSLGDIPLNAPFLIAFIGLFAVLAGPVNLFLLAPATRRHRLFWTTPLISCAASLLLILVIVLQDGFGGQGERVMVTRLFPGQRQAVVVQEQVARTGVLLSRQFTVPEDVVLSPLKMPGAGTQSYEQSGRTYSGGWFTSRRVQAQRVEAIVPSRAEIELVDAGTADTPPVVVSSIPATLRQIRYLDPSGHRWQGHDLHTGERMTLQRESAAAIDAVAAGSDYLFHLQTNSRDEPGSFFAVADDGPFIETLPSIRWRKQQAVYLGTVAPAR